MILTRTYENDKYVKFLKQKQIPFVAVGKFPDDDVVQVDHDNVGACKELVTVLFAKRDPEHCLPGKQYGSDGKPLQVSGI